MYFSETVTQTAHSPLSYCLCLSDGTVRRCLYCVRSSQLEQKGIDAAHTMSTGPCGPPAAGTQTSPFPVMFAKPSLHPPASPLCAQERLQRDTGTQRLSIAWKYPSPHPSPKAAGHPSTDLVVRYEVETSLAIGTRRPL